MTDRIVTRPNARQDLVDRSSFIARDNPDAADRFLEATKNALEQLAETPKIGRTLHLENPNLVGIRLWLVPGFRNHVIFYRPLAKGIEVIRILHAARDWKSLLEE